MLIVDDEAPIRFAVHRYFQEQGWRVDQAEQAGDAIALLQSRRYGVVIADLRLENLADDSGFEVVREARRVCPSCYVVLLTAYGDDAVRQRAWDEGANTFLSKPVSLSRLSDMIHAFPSSTAPVDGVGKGGSLS
jgi:DNA-binding response OmpR family regulator